MNIASWIKNGRKRPLIKHLLCHVLLFCNPMDCILQGFPWDFPGKKSMGFPRQEYWSTLPFPPPGDLSDPRIETVSPVSSALAGGFFTTEPLGTPNSNSYFFFIHSIQW